MKRKILLPLVKLLDPFILFWFNKYEIEREMFDFIKQILRK